MSTPLTAAHEALARAWVLWRLGLNSEAGRVAARLAASLPAQCPDPAERAILLAGLAEILRATGRAALADELAAAGQPERNAAD